MDVNLVLKISSSVSPTEINRSTAFQRYRKMEQSMYTTHLPESQQHRLSPNQHYITAWTERGAGPVGIETLSSYLAEPWILQPTRTTGKRFNILQVKSQSFLSIFNPHLKKNLMKPTRKSTWNLSIYTILVLFFMIHWFTLLTTLVRKTFVILCLFEIVIKMKNLVRNSLFYQSNQLPMDIIKFCLSLWNETRFFIWRNIHDIQMFILGWRE